MTMIVFPGESEEYSTARNALLEREIGLDSGTVTQVKLSELFAPDKDALVIYNYMFPRHSGDLRPGPKTGESARLPLAEGPCPSRMRKW